MIASRRLASLPLLLAGLAPLAWMLRALRPHAEPGAVPSARPAPFLHTARFALLAMAMGGVLLWSAPAEAQTATVLIKNTGRSVLIALIGPELNSTSIKRAQAFTTGANTNGYTLSSIGFDFHTIDDPSTADEHLTVTLNENDNGNPGDALCTLSDPVSFTSGAVNTFDAPTTCPTLAASTTYFAVIERVTNTSDTISLETTSSSSEDSGGAAGWSIANERHFLQSHFLQSGSWLNFATQSHPIEVKGTLNPEADVLVSNTGQETIAKLTLGPKLARLSSA